MEFFDHKFVREACKGFTVEAPRHEAGFRVIFGPQNDALQMGYGAGNIDRPASPKVPIKNEARKRFFLLKVTLRIKYALEALQSFARN